MAPDTAPCAKCGTDIQTDVDRCPACGYDPAEEGKLKRGVTVILGGLIGLTGIGAPLGLWMIHRAEKAKQRKPAQPS